MEALIYFALWGILIFVMLRFGCGAHVMGGSHQGHGKAGRFSADRGLRWVAPETDIDPVCGKTVRTAAAKPSVHDGMVYYFCSRECREIFETAPELYLHQDGAATSEKMEHANV